MDAYHPSVSTKSTDTGEAGTACRGGVAKAPGFTPFLSVQQASTAEPGLGEMHNMVPGHYHEVNVFSAAQDTVVVQQHQPLQEQNKQQWQEQQQQQQKQVLPQKAPAHAHSATASLGMPHVSHGSSSSGWSIPIQKVRAVVAVGGTFRALASTGSWEYSGDITYKVVGIPRSSTHAELQALLASRAELGAAASNCCVKYALPGSAGTFIDVTTDEDLQDMWDEWDDFSADSSSKGARLQLYISGPRSSSTGSSGGSPWHTLHSSRLLNMGSWQPPTPTMDDDDTGDMAACLTHHSLDARAKAGSSAAPGRGLTGSTVAGAAGAGSTKSSLRSSKSSSCTGSVADAQSLVTSSSVRFAADVPSADAAAAIDAAEPGQHCPSCVSLKAAAVLATIAEHQGSGARHGSFTASSSLSIPHPVRRPPGRRQTSPDLKQIMRQLKVQVEMIMPHELEVLRFIASGAFGDVFLARWHGTEVAVKCLSSNLLVGSGEEGGSSAAGSAAAADLMQEASMLAALHHPNIVAVYGFVPPPQDMLGRCSFELPARPMRTVSAAAACHAAMEVSGPAIVSEYMAAGSLHSALQNQAEWLKSSMAKVKVLLDTARGLSYLHSKAVTHFDLKTANLLFTIKDRTPIVKVADFGLAKRRQQTYVTGVDSLRGTLPWIAPEVIQNPESVTEAADVYSLGIIAWQLWTFQEPFEDVPFHTLLHQLSTQGALRLAVPGSPAWGEDAGGEPCPAEPAPGYSELMQRCWSVEPASRPSSRQLVGELQEMLVALKRNKN